MRIRPRFAAALLACVFCAPLSAAAQSASDGDGFLLRNARQVHDLIRSRAAWLGTSAGPDPDTVYLGKSFVNHTGPLNYWNLYVGSYLPGTNAPNNTMWDWDNSAGAQAPDSLQGWWPYEREYNSTGGLTLTDDQRPWWCLDYGNVGNFVLSQQSSAKRTFGVVGYWHADGGRTQPGGSAVMWTPLSGARSAWCGMRQYGDYSVQDQVTHNYFNGDAVAMFGEFGTSGTGGTGKRLPGYLDQMDQMLYRDIAIANGNSLSISFLYRTRMSTSIGTTSATRAGWFHGDPLAVTAGNFISSSAAGTNAPQDSFMVYIGSPVNDAAVKLSDGVIRPVYDQQRRWFSEVLRIFDGAPYYEVFERASNNPVDTLAVTPSAAILVPAAQVSSILNTSGNPGLVRLVFRVKTNRGFSDADFGAAGYHSGARGAAQVDDVTIDTGAGPVVIGDFETPEQGGANAIDNRFPLPPSLQPTDVWRSTGKPPSVWFHVEPLSNLTYNDLCGPPNSPARLCNISGNVVTPANHDLGESMSDSRYTSMRETMSYIMSPSIAFVPGPGGAPNSQGITASIASVSDDYVLWYDIYAGMFNLQFTGMTWVFGQQTYPALQTNGCKTWGDRRYPGFTIFNPEPQCFTDAEPFFGDGFPFRTSNASGIPDSLHLLIGVTSQCFRFNITLGCNSSEGGYFDNIAFAFVDQPGVPGQASAGSTVTLGGVSSDIWQFVNDTFPANETPGLPGTAAFDTTTGLIRTGLNNAQATGNQLRFDIQGDSSVCVAGNATVTTPDDPNLSKVRVDLVFRILPGPGNYQISAGRLMPPGGVPTGVLLQVPTNQAGIVASGDASFWGQYIANAGEVSTGDHNAHTIWDPLTWNSARMDTAERNIFPVGGSVPTGTGLSSGFWMSTYHESDPKFAALGVNKFKCFVIDTTKTAQSTATLNNVSCNGVVPAWLTTIPQSRTGYDGNAQTMEFTKILPDGLLTPGSHVQYFYRKSHAIDPFVRYAMCPDTNLITPQNNEGSFDMHRWQEFSVLPDRWKHAAFGGSGMACMLYVDLNDRRGNEGHFVSVMDSIGATAGSKWGAHNGWTAPGTTNLVNLDVRTNMSVAVSNKNSQPGTTWDMYGVKASESLTTNAGGLGNRLANRAGMGFAAGREAKSGPTPEMLRTYYRVLEILTGDLNSGILGPFTNRSQNDIALLSDFLTTAAGSALPRGIFIQGDGFGQSEKAAGGVDPAHVSFMTDDLGLVFRNPSYMSISGNTNACADILMTNNLTVNKDIFGVANACTWSNDVYNRNPVISESAEGAYYENAGANGPYVSEVVKPATALRQWVAVTSGYEIEHLYSRYCETGGGRLAYYYFLINKVFGGICQITGSPATVLDTPQGGRAYTNFMKIGNAVMRQGASQVLFGVAKAGRVQVEIYDVAGRKVRNLADRVFPAGEHTLQWDGADNAGAKVAPGVYFVRSSVQKDAGRIIVLNR